MNEACRLTPIHHWHELNGARFVLQAGWKQVESYGNPEEESKWISGAVGVCDLTPIAKIDVRGKDSAALLGQWIATQPIPPVNFHIHARCSGGEVGAIRAHISRLSDDRFLIVAPPDAREPLLMHLSQAALPFPCCHVTDLTSAFATFRIAGPRSSDVLRKLCPVDFSEGSFAMGRCTQAPMARVPVLILRDDCSKLLSYLVLASRDYGEYAWRSIMLAGHGCGLRGFGSAVHDQIQGEDE